MVKLYKSFLVLVLSALALAANAISVTINVDSPERVKLSVNYVEQAVVAGDNVFEIEPYTSVAIEAKSGALLRSVTRSSDGGTEYISGMTSCNIYPDAGKDGETWTVVSALTDDVRTGKCTVSVDDASKVRAQLSGTYTTVTLADGDNELSYIPEVETQLMIGSANYSSPLYRVTLNGEPVTAQYGTWNVTLSEGAKIAIEANFPDVDVPVRFAFADDESKGVVTGVSVDNTAVDNWDADDFSVKAGSMVTVGLNLSDYAIDEFTVNGSPVYAYSTYSLTVTDETTFGVKAHKYGTITATLDIDNPDNVVVYRGQYYNNNVISGLVAGKNELELSETNTVISMKPASGCYITSVTDNNGNTYSVDYSGYYTVTLTDGMELTVVSGAISRDQHAVVYIDDRTAPAQYFSFTRSDRSEVEVGTGYNTLDFYSGDMPMGLSWYGAPCANVYLNGEVVNPLYEGSTSYQFTLADGDVLKLYLASNPKKYDVSFATDGVDASAVGVKRDIIQTVADWAGGFSALQGTRVDIAVDGDAVVTVNGTALEADADGVYTFTVDADADVRIARGGVVAEPVDRPVKMWLTTKKGETVEEVGYWTETLTDNGDGTYYFADLMNSGMDLGIALDTNNRMTLTSSILSEDLFNIWPGEYGTDYKYICGNFGETFNVEYIPFYPHGKDAYLWFKEVEMYTDSDPSVKYSYYQDADNVEDSFFSISLEMLQLSTSDWPCQWYQLRFRFLAEGEEPGSYLPTGIRDVNAADRGAAAGVYNMSGVKVADTADLNSLPAGIYVVDGKKVVVSK